MSLLPGLPRSIGPKKCVCIAVWSIICLFIYTQYVSLSRRKADCAIVDLIQELEHLTRVHSSNDVQGGVPLTPVSNISECRDYAFALTISGDMITALANLEGADTAVVCYLAGARIPHLTWERLKNRDVNTLLVSKVTATTPCLAATASQVTHVRLRRNHYFVTLFRLFAVTRSEEVSRELTGGGAFFGFAVDIDDLPAVVKPPFLVDKFITKPLLANLLSYFETNSAKREVAYRHLSWSHYIPCGFGITPDDEPTIAPNLTNVEFVGQHLNNVYSETFRRAVRKENIFIGLEGGNLLGWWRSCADIGYDRDIDFSFWTEDVTKETFRYMATGHEPGTEESSVNFQYKLGGLFVPWRRFGTPDAGLLELSFLQPKDYQRIDLIHAGRFNETHRFTSMTIHDSFTVYQCLWKHTGICASTFFEGIYTVPCDPEPQLFAMYSAGWKQPMFDYAYCMSGNFHAIEYTEADWIKLGMFKEFWKA